MWPALTRRSAVGRADARRAAGDEDGTGRCGGVASWCSWRVPSTLGGLRTGDEALGHGEDDPADGQAGDEDDPVADAGKSFGSPSRTRMRLQRPSDERDEERASRGVRPAGRRGSWPQCGRCARSSRRRRSGRLVAVAHHDGPGFEQQEVERVGGDDARDRVGVRAAPGASGARWRGACRPSAAGRCGTGRSRWVATSEPLARASSPASGRAAWRRVASRWRGRGPGTAGPVEADRPAVADRRGGPAARARAEDPRPRGSGAAWQGDDALPVLHHGHDDRSVGDCEEGRAGLQRGRPVTGSVTSTPPPSTFEAWTWGRASRGGRAGGWAPGRLPVLLPGPRRSRRACSRRT